MKIIVMNYSKSKKQICQEAQEHKKIISQIKSQTPAGRKRKEQYQIIREAVNKSFAQIDTSLFKYRKYRMLLAIGYSVFLTLLPGAPVLAAGNGDSGVAILKLMQQF